MVGASAQGAVNMTELVASGVSAKVLAQLEAQGLPFKRSMKLDMPDFPSDITLVEDADLMVMASKYMENMNFLRTQAACSEIAEVEADALYEEAVSQGLLNKTTGKPTEKATILKAQVLTDPTVKDLSDAASYAHAYHKMIRTILENIERYYQLVSRELTRRTSSNKSPQWNRYVP